MRARSLEAVSHRRFKFSLAFLLLATTAACFWFAKISIEARRQKEAVERVLKNGGSVYEWDFAHGGPIAINPTSQWLRNLLGEEYGRRINMVRIVGVDIDDLSPLCNLADLEDLGIFDTQASDLEPLSRLVTLKTLWLDGNEIADISPLKDLPALDTLSVKNNRVIDVACLAKLRTLRVLVADNNQIRDIRPLAALTNLQAIHLGHNRIDDVSVLHALTRLTDVTVHGNPLTNVQIQGLRNALPNLTFFDEVDIRREANDPPTL
jgi:hypothetical protein